MRRVERILAAYGAGLFAGLVLHYTSQAIRSLRDRANR